MFANISWPQLLILLILVVLVFGTTKLKGLGKDVGGAIKGFKKAMNDEEQQSSEKTQADSLEQKDADFSEKEKTAEKEKTES